MLQVESYQSKEHMMLKKEPQSYPFDYFFELTQLENDLTSSSDEN